MHRLILCLLCRVYPRLCGGNGKTGGGQNPDTGLSPLVRGKLSELLALIPGGGSIPACAGETQGPICLLLRRWVYPRLCGGNMTRVTSGGNPRGLSPLVRGKL